MGRRHGLRPCLRTGLLAPVQSFCQARQLPLAAVVLVAYGIGTLVVYLVFVPGLVRWIAQTAAGLLLVGTLVLLHAAPPWVALLAACSMTLLAVAVYLRCRDRVVAAVLAAAGLSGAHAATTGLVHWRYIVLGFALLAAGALASLRKGVCQHAAPPPPAAPPSP